MPPRSKPNRRGLKLSIITTVGLLLIITLATLVGGKVTGKEFSPTHFQTRSFSFREIPIIRLQVTPITRSSLSSNLTNYLRSQNMLTIPSHPPTDWDLSTIRRGVSKPVLGDAEILTSYLELSSGKGSVWEQWSRDNPQKAKVFWPVIQRLAERELYLMLPELFALADQSSDAATLQSALDQYLPIAYQRLADDLSQADQPLLAKGVLEDALKDYPNNADLKTSLDALQTP